MARQEHGTAASLSGHPSSERLLAVTDSQKSDETATGTTPDNQRTPAPSPAAFAARRPAPAPAAPRPGAAAPAPAVAAPAAHTTPLEEAARFARVEEDGHVFLLVGSEEFPVGQYPDATRDEALAYFVRKYDDAVSQVMLLEARLAAKAPAGDMHKTLKHLAEQVAERKMVGDVLALDARIEALGAGIKEAEAAERAEAEAVRARELAAREAIVAEAEEISAKDPASIQWKTSSNRMNELFEAWKAAQKNGPRLGRSNEDALWKRFRSARTVFDRHRRAYFSQLDNENAEAKRAKEDLIARAEALSTSTDWGNTASEYRSLMDEWKASKRASRKDDDALWARFRAAQDKFFAARQAANEVIDEEFASNLVVKEALLKEAQAILPVTDLNAARKALQSIRDRWEEAGKVPRADMGRMEAGIRKVEEAVKAAEDEHWQRSNPETKARTNSALSQLEAAITSLEEELAAAEKDGNAKKIADAREALEARQQWLETLRRSAQDFS